MDRVASSVAAWEVLHLYLSLVKVLAVWEAVRVIEVKVGSRQPAWPAPPFSWPYPWPFACLADQA